MTTPSFLDTRVSKKDICPLFSVSVVKEIFGSIELRVSLKNQLYLLPQLLQKFKNAMLMTASSLLRKTPSQPSMTPSTRSTRRFLSQLKQRTMDRYPSWTAWYPERMVLSLLMFTENLLIRTGTWIFIHTTRRNTK